MAIKKMKKPTCCLNPNAGSVAPPIYLSSLGPSLPLDSKNEVIIRYKLQQAKILATSAEKNAKDNLDFIMQELENTKLEIQNLRAAMKELDESNVQQSSAERVSPKLISDACKLKSSLREDLADLMREESYLRRQLCLARIAYRNAKLDVIVLAEDMKKYREAMLKGIPLFLQWHEKEKEILRRIGRESRVKKNAVTAREETITSVANSITDHVLQKIPGSHNATAKQIKEARSARLSISNYLKASFRKARERKAMALTEIQLRQNRQMENLIKLKNTISDIKKTLSAKNQLKRMHDEEIALEKTEVKNLLQAQGANPYLAEYLLAIEEKQREVQRKMLVEEQKRLLDMQREYSKIEASKAKEESEKKKWDEFWAQKKKERVSQLKKENFQKYFDVEGEEETAGNKSVSDKGEETSQEFESSQEVEPSEDENDATETKRDSIPGAIEAGSSKGKSNSIRGSKESSKKKASTGSAKNAASLKSEGSAKSGQSGGSKKRKSEPAAAPSEPPKATSPPPLVPPEAQPTQTLGDPSVRRAMHLDYVQKDSIMKRATENTRAVLMNGRHRNVFDFGEVPVGGTKYLLVSVANVGFETVKLKMSILNPYGPFTFCNSLRDIPTDNFFSLKFKFQPVEEVEYHETVKIEEEGGKSGPAIMIKLKGMGLPPNSQGGE